MHTALFDITSCVFPGVHYCFYGLLSDTRVLLCELLTVLHHVSSLPTGRAQVRQWMEEAGREAVERVYSASERLDLESTVLFVHALVEVSMTELFPQANHVARPRIFSLQKLVEVSERALARCVSQSLQQRPRGSALVAR